MNLQEAFSHYRTHHSVPIPRDARFLQGMFTLRLSQITGRVQPGEIIKSAPSRNQVQIRSLDDGKTFEWVSWHSLVSECVLLHSSGDLWACVSALSRLNAKVEA